MFRLGGAKRRFILAVAKHRCGACEAQKVQLVQYDVVGLDLFFVNTYEKHTLPAMNIVCWGTGLQRVIPLRDQSGETLEERTQKQLLTVIWKASHPCCRPAAPLVLRHFRGES